MEVLAGFRESKSGRTTENGRVAHRCRSFFSRLDPSRPGCFRLRQLGKKRPRSVPFGRRAEFSGSREAAGRGSRGPTARKRRPTLPSRKESGTRPSPFKRSLDPRERFQGRTFARLFEFGSDLPVRSLLWRSSDAVGVLREWISVSNGHFRPADVSASFGSSARDQRGRTMGINDRP